MKSEKENREEYRLGYLRVLEWVFEDGGGDSDG